MGVDLSDIMKSEERTLKDFTGQIIAIDAYNTIYQFLASIRQPNGIPLMDSKGRITSHLSGLFFRTINLIETGIKPIYIYDGPPLDLKKKTITERITRREKAEIEWADALTVGDIETARSKAQMTARLTKEQADESKKLLDLMGIPWLEAVHDGEAQASVMVQKGMAFACASQDFDSLLFGAHRLIRNLTITGRRKLPRKKEYVEVSPELISLESNLNQLNITREQLVDLAILVGTDFNPGIKGVGPKTALKLIKEYKTLEQVLSAKSWTIENYPEIRVLFLNPEYKDVTDLKWREPQDSKIMEFLCEGYEFSNDRVSLALARLSNLRTSKSQTRLDAFA